MRAVLVPLDGSARSAEALPVGRDLASRLGASLHVLRAVAKAEEVPAVELELAGIEADGREVVVDLDAAGAIHEALRRLAPAVACMASHGRGRSAALVGSVALDVVTRGHDPVVVVGPRVGEKRGGPGVLGAIDEGPEAIGVLRRTLEWASMLGEPATVVTVAEPVPDPVRDVPVRRMWGPDGDPEAYLRARLADVGADAGSVDVSVCVIWDAVGPADGLALWLLDHPVRLVAVGAAARTRLARLAVGSTAAAVVRRSPFPVLVVPEEA